MKLYIHPDTGKAYRSAEAALKSIFIEVEVGASDDIAIAAGPCFSAIDDMGDRIISPYPRDIVEWCVGRVGVSIQMLHIVREG